MKNFYDIRYPLHYEDYGMPVLLKNNISKMTTRTTPTGPGHEIFHNKLQSG